MTTRYAIRLAVALGATLGLTVPALGNDEPAKPTTVGMPVRLSGLVLPGPELEPKPLAGGRAPVVVRVVRAAKHGTAHRYDLEVYALEPGKYDLRDYLQRKDGAAAKDLPEIPFEAVSVLPPGQQLPHELAAKKTAWLPLYTLALIGGGVLWVVVALAILLVGRGRKRDAAAETARPPTAAERLRPLVERALSGATTNVELAELERTLLAYWRRRLDLENRPPDEAIRRLRADADAGPLLAQLEAWLHRPGPRDKVNIDALLHPYKNVAAEALDP